MSDSASSAEILVAGGGIIGLSIAWRLAQAGCSVTVCDKGNLAGEASWAAAGMLAPGGEFNAPSDETQMAVESRGVYRGFVRQLEQASGLNLDFQECGALELAYSGTEFEELESKAGLQAQLGIQSKAVEPIHAGVFWPRLALQRPDGARLVGARFYPNDAIVDPRKITSALAVACRRMGVSLFEHCAVTGMDVQSDCVIVASLQGSARYDAAVIAAGAWSSSIPVSGLPVLPECDPVKGQLIAYRQPAQTCNTILRQGHFYMLQRTGGTLIAGASMERAGFDRTLSETVERKLAAWAGSILPHLAETTPAASWVGFRPVADGLQLGPWHSDRLLLAYGHFRNGILLTPATADRIAQTVSASLGRPLGARV